MKDAVIGSPPCAIRPHIARVIDQSDRNMPLHHVIKVHAISIQFRVAQQGNSNNKKKFSKAVLSFSLGNRQLGNRQLKMKDTYFTFPKNVIRMPCLKNNKLHNSISCNTSTNSVANLQNNCNLLSGWSCLKSLKGWLESGKTR